ncbi:MAG TPA: bacteriohemerythrin [Accumulibacter sp.]|jgi:hemerythrin|nr:bacteriohemerythrin [Accumulibacter sp.]HQC80619.1 bacteriohemerythrin [Accumulibacter sp.]
MSLPTLFQWSEEYELGITEIDDQHKGLVDLLNQLHKAIREHRGTTTSRRILDQLIDYTRTHFLLEESLMRVTAYPGVDRHRTQHKELISQIEALQRKMDQESVAISFELLHFLRNWLIQHIHESDKRFGAHFHSVRLAATYAAWRKESGQAMQKQKKKWWKFW